MAKSDSACTSPAHELRDLPDWLDPMVIKELRQSLGQKFFLIPFLFVHGVMLLALVLEWASMQENRSVDPDLGKMAFWGALYLITAIIMPLRGFEALQEERDRGNTELLLMAGLTRWRIVRGKWFVQFVLTLLVIISVLPYLLVRYFFGAVEFWENLIQFLGVIGASLANSAIFIGTSGYKSYLTRGFVGGLSLLYVFGIIAGMQALAMELSELSRGALFYTWYAVVYGLGFFALYTLLGLQLGRAHLRLYLAPGESSPTFTVATLMVLGPFILICGAIAVCIYGAILVLLLFIYLIAIFDRPVKVYGGNLPTPQKPAKQQPIAVPGGF